MAVDLYQIARQYLTDPKKLRAGLSTPVLVWEGSPPKDEGEQVLVTVSGIHASRPSTGDALVFELKKGNSKGNAFAMGITVGRTEHNDVVLDDSSVSRFHAFFQQDAKSQAWKLVDAESKNGTWLNAQKLEGTRAEIVSDGARIRFGEIDVLYLSPDQFMAYLAKKMER